VDDEAGARSSRGLRRRTRAAREGAHHRRGPRVHEHVRLPARAVSRGRAMTLRERFAEAWRAWVALLDQREPATALALVRIAASLVLVVDSLYVARVGLVGPLWSRYPDGFATGYAGWADALGISAFGLWAIALGALACVLVGAATRVACVVYVLVSAQQSAICPESESAIDMV